jgi:hypothetical protein
MSRDWEIRRLRDWRDSSESLNLLISQSHQVQIGTEHQTRNTHHPSPFNQPTIALLVDIGTTGDEADAFALGTFF